MDDRHEPEGSGCLPFLGPHWAAQPEDEAKPSAPLRLHMRPSGPILELNRCETLVGRHVEANLRLPLPDVSRKHCHIVFADGSWQIVDLKSMNGVFVNELKVQQANLHHRDIIRIGGFMFEVDMNESDSPPPLRVHSPEQVLQSIADALPPPENTAERPARKAS